jgi:hypothetical protein
MLPLGPIRSVIVFTDPCRDHCIVCKYRGSNSFSFTLKAALQQHVVCKCRGSNSFSFTLKAALQHPNVQSICYYLGPALRESQPVLTHQYVTLYDYLLFLHLAYKTKIGTAKRWETIKSKPLGTITIIGQSEMQGSNQIIFITLLREMLHFTTPFISLSKLCKNAALKPFC